MSPVPQPGPDRDWVLVGGGHAHVQVLRRLVMAPLPGTRVTVVVDDPQALPLKISEEKLAIILTNMVVTQ